jgi:hypothetical protein
LCSEKISLDFVGSKEEVNPYADFSYCVDDVVCRFANYYTFLLDKIATKGSMDIIKSQTKDIASKLDAREGNVTSLIAGSLSESNSLIHCK